MGPSDTSVFLKICNNNGHWCVVKVLGLLECFLSSLLCWPWQYLWVQRKIVLWCDSPHTFCKNSFISVGIWPCKVSILENDFWSSSVIQPEAISSPILNGSTETINTTLSFQAYQRGGEVQTIDCCNISHVGAWNGEFVHSLLYITFGITLVDFYLHGGH